MNIVVLSLGCNSSDCQNRMRLCVEWLNTVFCDFKVSQIYETPAINGKDGNYLNAVAACCTDMNYDTTYQLMKEYEINSGRTIESKKNGEIPIDIDIVIWNDEILREKDFKQSYFQIGWSMLKNNMI